MREGGVTTITTTAKGYWQVIAMCQHCSKHCTCILSFNHHKNPMRSALLLSLFYSEETKVLGSVTLGSPWLVGEPRFEFGKSSPRGFFHLPCSWCQSGRSLTVTFKAPERLCQEEARTSQSKPCSGNTDGLWPPSGGPHSAFSLKKLILSGLWSPNKRPKRNSRRWKWAIAISVLLKNGF